MRVLVTGGAGYVGSHTVARALEAGHEVVVLDDLSTGHRDAVGAAPLVVASLADTAAVMDAFARHRPDAVIHFAAKSIVADSMREPGHYFRENVLGAANLLDAMRAHGTPVVVVSSTAAVYGTPQVVPIPEGHPLAPINVYGDSKLAVERLAVATQRAHGLRVALLRYFNVAGARPERGLGERHSPETHLVPLALEVARGALAALPLYGDAHPTEDGTCIRDYIHVVDLADAHLAALERLAGAPAAEPLVLNLGTGRGHSVRSVLETARAVTGHPIPIALAPARAGDPPVLVAAVERAREVLGWRARHDLREMVESAWRFLSGR